MAIGIECAPSRDREPTSVSERALLPDGRAFVVAHGRRTMPVWGYEFWIEEGADAPAERDAREVIDRLVRYLESIQRERDPGGPLR